MDKYLISKRFYLRRLTEQDTVHLHQLDSDPEVMRYINGGEPRSLEMIQNEIIPKILSWYEKFDDMGLYAAIHNVTQGFMGWFLLRPFEDDLGDIELGYRLHRHNWGQGFATEGSLALLKKGFHELELPKIGAIAMPANKPSITIMKKIGMKYEARYHHSSGVEVVKYSITREAYLQSHSTD